MGNVERMSFISYNHPVRVIVFKTNSTGSYLNLFSKVCNKISINFILNIQLEFTSSSNTFICYNFIISNDNALSYLVELQINLFIVSYFTSKF